MWFRIRATALGAALCCACRMSASEPEPAPAPDELPERVSIRALQSDRSLLEQTLTVTRTPQGFSAGDRPIDASLVQALLRAAAAPVPELNAGRFKPFIGDVRAEAERLGLPPLTAQRFADRVSDPRTLAEVLKAMRASVVRDDYPSVAVEIAWPSGARLTLTSDDPHPLMLPWSVNGPSETWNPDISAAVAALLPADFLNGDRLIGKHLTASVAWYGKRLYRDTLGVEEAELVNSNGGRQ